MEVLNVRGKELHFPCGSIDCERQTSKFCKECRTQLCVSCMKKHTIDQSEHTLINVGVGKDDALKPFCEIHHIECEHSCCDELVCTYCLKQNHSKHESTTLIDDVDDMKTKFKKKLTRIETIVTIMNSTMESIKTVEKEFEELLTYRKMLCLTQYLASLENEEKTLWQKFQGLWFRHQTGLQATVSSKRVLEEYLNATDIEFLISKSDIIDHISSVHIPEKLPLRLISLSQFNFLSLNPLGADPVIPVSWFDS